MLQSDDYFSSSVPLFEIPDRLRDLIQPVTLVDDGSYLFGRHELAHDAQVFFARSRQERNQLLTHEPGQHKRCDQTGQKTKHPPTASVSDHDAYPLRI